MNRRDFMRASAQMLAAASTVSYFDIGAAYQRQVQPINAVDYSFGALKVGDVFTMSHIVDPMNPGQLQRFIVRGIDPGAGWRAINVDPVNIWGMEQTVTAKPITVVGHR